ncbi:MAG TPA: TraR/DksA family transcriptional regulator [Treponemataceae bacterium]|nr:TraR/DksA family transcriptional regulator [Treponemataceae bacterium]
MKNEFTKKMKEKLIAEKNEIVEHLVASNSDFEKLLEASGGQDSIDLASDDINRRLLDAIGTKNMNRITLIENALARIEQEKYGLCITCNKRIPQERLEALPYALMCVDCKQKEERRR